MDKLNLEVEWQVDNAKLRSDMAEGRKVIEGVGQSVEDVTERINKNLSGLFSDSAKEIEDYKRSMQGLGELKPPVDPLGLDELKSRISDIEAAKSKLEGYYKAGAVSAEDYRNVLGSLLATEKQLVTEIENYGKVAEKQTGVNKTLSEQEQLLQALREEYRGVVSEGSAAWQGLSPEQQKVTLELIRTKSELGFVRQAQKEVNQAFDEGTINYRQHEQAIAGLIAKEKQLVDETKRISNIGKDGFDSMGNSMGKATAASGALTTGLNRAYRAVSRLAYLIPGLGIAGLFSLAWDPLWKLIQGTGLFTKKLSDAQKEAKRLGEALDSSEYKKAIVSISELKMNVELAKKGLYDKKTALNEYNSTIGAVAGQLTEFNQVEQALIDNADKYIEMTLRKAAANAASEEAAEKMVRLRKEMLKSEREFANGIDRLVASTASYAGNMYGTSRFDISAYDKILKEEGARRKKAFEQQNQRDIDALHGIAKDFQKQAADIAKEMGGVLGLDQTKEGPGLDKTVEEANRLLQKIEDLRTEFSKRAMSKDEAELQALRDRFSKIALEVQKFNKNPKNKIKIPIEDLDDIRDSAIADLLYSQNTVRLEKQYAEEYKIFQAYEQLKKDTSAQYANERYADQLAAIQSYEARLAQEIASIDPETSNALEKKRLEGLQALQKDQADKRKEAEDKAMSDLLALMVTYDQRRKRLLEKHEADRLKVARNASTEELAELDRHQAEELAKLDNANIQKLDAYKDLFEGIRDLSDVAARHVIANAKAMLASDLNITNEEREKIEKAIAEAERSLRERLYDRVDNLADAFGQMANSIGQVNEGLGDMLGLVSNVLRATVDVNKGIADLRAGLANYKTNKTDGGVGILGSISAIAGVAGAVGKVVGAVSSVVGSVVGLFKASRESARQAAEEIRRYQESVLAGELEHNRILRERAREYRNINELTNEQIRLQTQLLNLQTSDAQRDFDELLRRIQGEGEQITGQRKEKYGGFLGIGRKTRVVDITEGLGGYTYEQLEELYTSNKLTQATRELFEQLRAAKEEVDSIADAWDALNEELLSRMTGGATADAIASSIIDGFKNGKRAVSDFADDMESIIQNALLSAMSYTVLDEPLQELIRQFREDAKDGLNNDEIERFKKEYGEIVQAGIDAIEEIEKLTGKGISDRAHTLSGAYARASQESIDILAGNTGAMRLHLYEISTYNKAQLAALNTQINLMNQHGLLLSRLEYLETIVRAIDESNDHLSGIKNNTTDSLAASLRAAGKFGY